MEGRHMMSRQSFSCGLWVVASRLTTTLSLICVVAMIVVVSVVPRVAADDWTEKLPTTNPSARNAHAMASIGGDNVLLFGGFSDDVLNGDTWIYNPSDGTWTEKSPTAHPSARSMSAMASIGDDKVLLFGGMDDYYGPNDETWVYDLSDGTWTEKSPTAHPSARSMSAMASIGDDKVLLFGGMDDYYGPNDETWVYDLSDGTWTEKSPTAHPSARGFPAMASIGGGKVLLFGGFSDDGLNGDTWIYNPSDGTWTEKSPTAHPSARSMSAMASIGDDKVLLFGGMDDYYGPNDETWVYDLSDGTWTEKSLTVHPSARSEHAMASIGGNKVLLFGGMGETDPNHDTWVYYAVPPAGITVTPTSGLTTTETGGTATFTVSADTAPTATVTVPLSSSDATEGTVPVSVTLPAGSTAAVTVTVTGVDDAILDGDVGYTIITGDPTSTDAAYNTLGADDVADVSVTNEDDDHSETRGDVDIDGQIDVIDVRLCYQIALGIIPGTAEQQEQADVDGDGDIDLDDVQYLAEFIIGIRTSFPGDD